ncbi:MAG: InlB B-repeat-containing protein, partial [Prevotellaceae bacterium]|nr:InlB B-repeat-containing protein [Prevotellaceae bacterium]
TEITQTSVSVVATVSEKTSEAFEVTGLTVTQATSAYTLTAEPTEGGSYTVILGDNPAVDVTTEVKQFMVTEGTVIQVEAIADEHFQFNKFTGSYADKTEITFAANGSPNKKKFTYGTADATITANFRQMYAVNIDKNIEHGTVIADKKEATATTTITLTLTPDAHYHFESVIVKDINEEIIQLSEGPTTIEGNTIAKFKIPGEQSKLGSVSVTATFAEDAKYTVTFSVNGENTTSDANYAGEPVEFPTVSPIAGYTFMGWTEQAIDGKQDDAPEFVENVVYPANNYAVYYAVFAKKEGEDKYVKVTSELEDWSGDYLVVYESGNIAFNGGLETLDATSNGISVAINDRIIEANETTNAATINIQAVTDGYVIQAKNGKYIGNTKQKSSEADNGLTISDTQSTEAGYVASISLDDSQNALITVNKNGETTLKYNNTSGQTRFRFYKSGQETVALYKKQEATYSDYCTTIIYVTSIKVATAPTTTAYKAGEKFNPAGLVITLTYSDKNAEDVEYIGNEDKFIFEPSLETPLTTENTSITITYASKEATQAITVRALYTYDITWMANGEEFTTTQVTEGDALVLPETSPDNVGDMKFMGWIDEENYYDAEIAPEYIVPSEIIPTEAMRFYAVYAKEETELKPNVVTYTFNSKSWGDATSSWTSEKEGHQYTSNQGVQVTTAESGANATSKLEFAEVTKVVVNYCTNSKAGAGTISVKVGDGTAQSYSVSAPSSGGTELRNTDDMIFENETGQVNITVECGTNSIYINSITITSKVAEHTYSDYTTRVSKATMSITSAKWSTFIAPFDVEIPEGVEAYTVTATEDALVYTPVETTTITACTPVVLFKDVTEEAFTQNFYGVDNETERTFHIESLVGTLDKIAKGNVPKDVNGAPVYLLQNNNDKVGFYMLDPDPGKTYSLNANRAYLVGVATASAKAYYGFDDNDPTGINNLRGERWYVPREGIFDLSGRKLSVPHKGVNIINGVKVIVK